MAGSIGNIDFVFNLVKELDVFIDSIPSRVKLSTKHKILIREYSIACLLNALCSGRGEFRLEENIKETVSILEFYGENQIELATKAIEGEISTLVSGLKNTVLLSPVVQRALYDVCTFAEKSDISLVSLLLSGNVDSLLEASHKISLFALLEMAESETDMDPVSHTVEIEWDSPDIAELESILAPPEKPKVELQAICGKLYIVLYRLFSECSQVTIRDMSSMTMGDFFYIEK